MTRSKLSLLVFVAAMLALLQCSDSESPQEAPKATANPTRTGRPTRAAKPPRPQDPPFMVEAQKLLGSRPPRPKQALALLQPHQDAEAGNARFLYVLANCLQRLRRYSPAFEALQMARTLDPSHPGYLFDMGACRFNQALFEESLHIWRELESMEEGRIYQRQRAAISYNRGACAKEMGFDSEAIEALTRAVALADDKKMQAIYLFELAGLQLNNHRYEAAVADFTRLLGISPGRWDFAFYLGKAQLELGNYKEAEFHLLNARRLAPSEFRIPVTLGNLCLKQNLKHSVDSAEGYFMEALEKNPLENEALRKLSTISRNQGDTEAAADYKKRCDTVEAQSKEITETLRTLRRRFQSNARDLEAHRKRVEIYLMHDRQKEADKALSRLLAEFPNNEWALLNMAYLLVRQGRTTEALYELDKIFLTDPHNAFANRDAAQILGRQGKRAEAIPYLERAVVAFAAKKPTDLRVMVALHQMLATCYQSVGDTKRAQHHFEIYKQLKAELDKAGMGAEK